MKLTKFALQNSKPISVMRFILACLGILILFSISREQYPNVPLYYVHILVPYPGASAVEIEEEITQKIEKNIKGLQHISNVSSLISDELSFTRVAYSQSISYEEFQNDYFELQFIINNMNFPSNSRTPIIDNFTYLDFMPIISVVVYSENSDGESATDTLITSANRVKATLERNNDISRIIERGLLEQQIKISLDKEKLDTYQISLYEISEAITSNHISIPAGTSSTSTSTINTYTSNEINDITALENIIIRPSRPPLNTPIFLNDIADISYFYDKQTTQIRYNGHDSVVLQIYKTEHADSISIVKSLHTQLQELERKLPRNITLTTVTDSTVNIRNSINVLLSNVLIGFALLFISLLLFLGMKPAVIAALEIPFTFATSFFILKLFGITLNTSTLFALVLVLGMIVDHGIVILENIIRLQHSQKMNRLNSITHGVSEVGPPIISSTLTTIGSFLPLAFMPGLIGKFLLPVPITITITLLISTISALIIIPINYMKIPGKDTIHELAIFHRGRKILNILLNKILNVKIFICIISLILAFISIWFLFQIPVSLYDTEEESFFFVDITMPTGSNLSVSNEVITKMETLLIPLQENNTISSIISSIGSTDIDEAEGIRFDKPHNAQLQIEIQPEYANRKIKLDETIAQVRDILDTIDGDFTMRIRKQRTGPPVSSAIGFRILGNNQHALQNIDTLIRDRLSQYSELSNIKSNLTIDNPNIRISVNTENAAQYGLNVETVGFMIRQWLSDDPIANIFINNTNTKVIATIDNISPEEQAALSYISFSSPHDGTLIPFDTIASLVPQKTLSSIYREEGKRMLKITADASSRDRIREINATISEYFETTLNKEYPDTIIEIGGEFDEFSALLYDILLLLLIGIFVVYIILVAEFRSYIQPILIMLTILFTTMGVSTYLIISQSSLSITILYAFIALIGVVVNGAIILVSTANKLLINKNISHTQAIKQATIQRFKPIVLTSLTTICGVLPTALGLSGKSPIWQPMASTIAIGLFFSMATTLFIIPAFYALLPKPKLSSY